MKIALTVPNAGAGRWCWNSWINAFNVLGHEAFDITKYGAINDLDFIDIDLLICSTSCPNDKFIEWRNRNPDKKVALNVLAWSDEPNIGMELPGIQATQGNIEWSKEIKPDVVFAQYSQFTRQVLLKNWSNILGYKISSLCMGADSTIYQYSPELVGQYVYDIVYVGGSWHFKNINLNKVLKPLIQKYRNTSILIGKGWNIPVDADRSEKEISQLFQLARVSPSVSEPHSTTYGYDMTEKPFKVMACGGLCVVDNVKEFESIGFNSNELLVAKNDKEYLELCEDAIKRPEYYEKIRTNGRLKVEQQHTYINRVQELLKDIYGQTIPI